MNNIYLKKHEQGKKIRGHNIQLWPLMMIYVCSVWRLSKSSMPVIYQHIFAILVTILHNLSSPHTTFSERAPHLNPFRRELVIKQYHKIAFKGSSIPLKNAWKTPNFRPFATINIKIIFGHDRSWIYRKWVSNMTFPLQRYFFFEAQPQDPRLGGEQRPMLRWHRLICELFNISSDRRLRSPWPKPTAISLMAKAGASS